jgi:hypothetical protein
VIGFSLIAASSHRRGFFYAEFWTFLKKPVDLITEFTLVRRTNYRPAPVWTEWRFALVPLAHTPQSATDMIHRFV